MNVRAILTVLMLRPGPLCLAFLLCVQILAAQDQPPQSSSTDDSITTADRFWISGQANFITQHNPAFSAKYSGPNSFGPDSDTQSSRVLTLYTGIRLTRTTDFLFDYEEAGGGGLSSALGIAGFTNLDVVRNPTLSQKPYMARIMLHQTIPLSKNYPDAVRGPLGLAPRVADRRIELHIGKLSTADFFDINGVGSDSHLQFMNWAADNDPAYDYAADTRGYTFGLVAEYFDHNWELRFGEMLMPTVANGIDLDWDLARARGQNLELETHQEFFAKKPTILRLLAFSNTANMGSYNEAIQQYLRHETDTPDVTATRRQGRVKYGFGFNAEQELGHGLRAYTRIGWNEGKNETFAYTEADNHFSIGADQRGDRWRRPLDKVAVTFISDGISDDHRRYLALGGVGFILGDGGLRYGREQIVETYYTMHLWRGIYISGDLQRVWNPGYNQDRGPAVVASFRLHIEDAVSFGHGDTR